MVKSEFMVAGEKVILREKRVSDAVNDYAWRCDAELSRLDALPPLRMSFEDYLAAYQVELRYPDLRRRYFAVDIIEGRHIGNCMYYDIDEERSQVAVGIMIGDRKYWGKGWGADAMKTLVNHILTDTALNRIYLHTLDWNTRAQRCFGKCGFMPSGRVIRGENTLLVMELHRKERQKAIDVAHHQDRKAQC